METVGEIESILGHTIKYLVGKEVRICKLPQHMDSIFTGIVRGVMRPRESLLVAIEGADGVIEGYEPSNILIEQDFIFDTETRTYMNMESCRRVTTYNGIQKNALEDGDIAYATQAGALVLHILNFGEVLDKIQNLPFVILCGKQAIEKKELFEAFGIGGRYEEKEFSEDAGSGSCDHDFNIYSTSCCKCGADRERD